MSKTIKDIYKSVGGYSPKKGWQPKTKQIAPPPRPYKRRNFNSIKGAPFRRQKRIY